MCLGFGQIHLAVRQRMCSKVSGRRNNAIFSYLLRSCSFMIHTKSDNFLVVLRSALIAKQHYIHSSTTRKPTGRFTRPLLINIQRAVFERCDITS